jgi:hypothetical protein
LSLVKVKFLLSLIKNVDFLISTSVISNTYNIKIYFMPIIIL